MEERFLEITIETAVRLGFYNEVPQNDLEAQVAQWFVKEGDVIRAEVDPNTGRKRGQVVCNLESEKGSKDVEAQGREIGARVKKILVEEEEPFTYNLHRGPLRLAVLEVGDAGTSEEVSQKKEPEDIHAPEQEGEAEAPSDIRVTPLARRAAEELNVDISKVRARLPEGTKELKRQHVEEFAKTAKGMEVSDAGKEGVAVKAAPKTRQLAKELGVELSSVQGTGPEGLILAKDVQEFVARKNQISEPVHTETSEPVQETDLYEVVRPSMRRKTTARHMAQAWKAPHASPGIDINPVPLLELRAKMKDSFAKVHGMKLRIDHFFVAACAYLLSQPEFRVLNACWHEKGGRAEMRLYKHANIGIATAIAPDKTRSGFSELVVPVVKHAETMSFIDIVKEAERLLADALAGNPNPEDLADLTFIVNNTGSPVEWRGIRMSGDEYPDPIFAAETAAILAFGAVREEGREKKMRIRLRFDHRICDGYEPKLFLRALQYLLEHPEQILTLR